MATFAIQGPTLISKLPRGASDHGRSRFSQVFGVQSHVLKKRSEICAAVDGDSINIYEIQNGRALASYPIPSDASFPCAPYSLRLKIAGASIIRRTYCVLRRRGQSYMHLYSTTEDTQSRQTVSSQEPIFAYLEEQQSPVLQIEILLGSEAILVQHESGSFQIFDATLTRSLTKGQFDITEKNSRVLASSYLTITQASRTILKARPDLVATIPLNSVLVAGIVRSLSAEHVQSCAISYYVWTLPLITSSAESLKPLVRHSIQLPIGLSPSDNDTAVFVQKSTKFVYKSQASQLSFELTGLLPRQTADGHSISPEQVSAIDIANNLVLCSTADRVILYNSLFRTPQAFTDIGRAGQKRKRGDYPTGPIRFIACFPRHSRVIGLRRNHLVAIDLSTPEGGKGSTSITQSSSLINSLGKGIISSNTTSKSSKPLRESLLGKVARQCVGGEEWNTIQKQLIQCIAQRDMEGFDVKFMEGVVQRSSTQSSRSSPIPVEILDFVITSIFQDLTPVNEGIGSNVSGLHVVFPAKETIEWLSRQGYLTTNRVRQAFSKTKKGVMQNFEPAAILEALMSSDPSLRTLQDYLNFAPSIESAALCSIIRHLLRRALIQKNSISTRTLPQDRVSAGQSDMLRDLALQASQDTDSVAIDIAALLKPALVRLSEHSQTAAVSVMRSTFERQDLVALIQFLRQQLFITGCTRSLQGRPHVDIPANGTTELPKPPNALAASSELSLDAILMVLSSAIDAIGPIGLLGAGEEDDFMPTLIEELSSELSRALEALEDATCLRGLLRETIRFAETVREVNLVHTSNGNSDKAAMTSGTIKTIFTESETDPAETSSALPLSLQSYTRIDQSKIRKGTGKLVERSRREMGMLQDRLRGVYSLERLVL